MTTSASKDTPPINPIMSPASFSSPTRQKTFIKNNPEQVALFNKAYENMNDEELRQNFHSTDKKMVAAMSLATQKMAEEEKSLSLMNKIKSAIVKDSDKKPDFNKHLLSSIKDIDDGLVNINAPEDFLGKNALQRLEDNKEEKAQKQKKAKVVKKVKLIETEIECEKKACTLKSFKLFITPKNESIADLIIETCERSSAKLINEKLDNALPITEQKGDKLIADLITSYNDKDEYHLVGGHLTQFQTNVKIAVEGQCDFGDAPNCPSIELSSKDQSFATLDLIITGNKKQHIFENTDTRLSKLRLNPKKTSSLGTIRSIERVLKLLKPVKHSDHATYQLNLTSCTDSKKYHYADFSPKIFVHPQNVQKFSFSVKYDIDKNKLSPSISYTARQDKDLQNLEVNAEELLKNSKRIISDVCGTDAIIGALENASKLYRKFAMLGKTDELADEAEGENNQVITDSSEEVPLFSKKAAGMLPPAINFSYLRKKVNLPDKNFSEIGYDQTFFISGSPLFKYEKEVDLLNFFWRKSKRYAMAAASAGLSEVALWASNKLELTESLENSFSNYILLMKDSVVKYHKEAQANKALTQQELLNEYNAAELSEQVDDMEVGEHLCTQKEEKALKASCVLKFSAAAETDDPNAGIVFSKAAGEDSFTYESTSMYAGINASLEGTLSVNLQTLKAIGFANKIVDGTEAGLKGQVTSADKTGESRFGVTIGHFAATNSDGTKKKQSDDEEPSDLCYQWFYSGLNVQIEAFIWYTKSSSRGEHESAEAAQNNQQATPGRRGFTEEKKDEPELFKIKTQKSLIDFCVFKASDENKEFWKKRPIKSIFKATGECKTKPA